MAKNFGSDFGPFGSYVGTQFFFSYVLPPLDVIHCRKVSLYSISRKISDPNSKKSGKKPYFGPDLGPLGPNLGHQVFFQNSGFVSH